jgi:hypothetical protein
MHTALPEKAVDLSPVVVRFPADEKGLCQLAADADTGGNLSEWVRAACREKLERRIRKES